MSKRQASRLPNKQAPKVRSASGWHHRFIRYFHAHALGFNMGFRNLALTPFTTLMTMIAIGICLSLPVTLFLFTQNIQRISQTWDQGPVMTLYIQPHSTSSQIEAIYTQIKQYPFAGEITRLTPQQALEEFQEASGLKDALALLPQNPLPGVISVEVNTRDFSDVAILEMKRNLEKIPPVQQVLFDNEWVEKWHTFLSLGKTFFHFLYFVVGMGVILVVANSIRLSLTLHRDEIEVFTLAGATAAFTRRPFLYGGILYGFFGGLIALLIVHIGTVLLTQPMDVLPLYEDLFSLNSLSITDTLVFSATCLGLGWGGAMITFLQQNRGV